MDFELSPQEEKFKQKVIGFFVEEDEVTSEAKKEWDSGQGFGPCCWEVLRKLGARGWLCPMWPKEYGGLELPYLYHYIVREQLHYFTDIFSLIGAGMAGPIILSHGSEQQRREYLPRIARGEIEFALGYTEPEAGSDLAALGMRAEDRGDYFLINGQKIFNTRAHYAQYHWLGARTEVTSPKHRGISLFIVDLKSAGITVDPIWTVGGMRTNEVFYDDVKVPKEAMVGEKNRGFYYILEALTHERMYTVSYLERDFHEIVNYINQKGADKNPLTRQRLAELAIDIEVCKLSSLRLAWILNSKEALSYEAAMLKIVVSETDQKLVNAAMQILGPYGQLKRGSKWALLDGKIEWRYRDSLETLVTRGTCEIMRNIIAQRALGLPRQV